jgi:predicted short-subunit dehydrogenase-like oxidoreductase (DUF2520 family)
MKITMIGAGKVGGHLARRLCELGHDIVQVFSRDLQRANGLAREIHAEFTNDLGQINDRADLYLLAVPDDAIENIAAFFSQEKYKDKLVAHTSGSTPMALLSGQNLQHCGVFYPLQSFSLGKKPDFSQVPICIDALLPEDMYQLKMLALQISPKVYAINDAQRGVLHVAAVFANNFTNYLFHISQQILEKEELPFELLLPLIQETANKLETGTPADMQTGPAIRGDVHTLERHLNYLEKYPAYKEIYELITLNIQSTIKQ